MVVSASSISQPRLDLIVSMCEIMVNMFKDPLSSFMLVPMMRAKSMPMVLVYLTECVEILPTLSYQQKVTFLTLVGPKKIYF